jgi:4-alpha-glucanotransferase
VNPLYLRVEDVPGAASLAELVSLAEQGRALNSERLIDRARAWAVKSKALESLFDRFEQGTSAPDLDRYIARQGWPLDGYTTFCALAERHGLPWQGWPSPYRRPTSQRVAAFAAGAEGKRRKRYHAWLQWLCDDQMAAASSSTDLVCDLAVGVDGEGADAWLWQDVFAMGIRVGAPPDDFNIDGQDWGLAPWDPWKLRGAAYEPYIETLRAAMKHARGLRLDHVMGLFRLFWSPTGSQPAQGTYVRYPGHDLLSLLCLEALRAGAYVVGEDLGTVEDEVREALARRGALSYKLLWFEPGRPPTWPRQALGAVTTHDLPTIAGVWSGSDLTAQRSAGVCPNEDGFASLHRRLEDWTGLSSARPASEVIQASYDLLAQAPCALLTAVLEDALAVEERPNMPGTIDQWPNWCLALPVPLEDIEQSPLAGAIAASLSTGAAGTGDGPGRGG